MSVAQEKEPGPEKEKLPILCRDEKLISANKPTSGILLFALSADIARMMMNQLVDNGVKKHYLAVVLDYTETAKAIDYSLKDKQNNLPDSQAHRDKSAQPTITEYQCLLLAATELKIIHLITRQPLLTHAPLDAEHQQIVDSFGWGSGR